MLCWWRQLDRWNRRNPLKKWSTKKKKNSGVVFKIVRSVPSQNGGWNVGICRMTYIVMWGFPKMVVPNNHGFSYKKWSFWGVLGVPPFKETPIWCYFPAFPPTQTPRHRSLFLIVRTMLHGWISCGGYFVWKADDIILIQWTSRDILLPCSLVDPSLQPQSATSFLWLLTYLSSCPKERSFVWVSKSSCIGSCPTRLP